MDILIRIKANTDLVIAQLGPQSGIDFGLNEPSLAYVEGFIERQRLQQRSAEATDRLISVFGSFLGECVIANYGGIWFGTDWGWGISFGGQAMAFPFSKTRKLFENGLEGGDSIVSFYRVIPHMFADQLRRAA